MRTNKDICSDIITNSIWIIDPRDEKITPAILLRLSALFKGSRPRSVMERMINIKLAEYHNCIIGFFFNVHSDGASSNITQSKTNIDFIIRNPNYYKGRLILDNDALLKLNEFIMMDDSKESLDWLLKNLDFFTAKNQEPIIEKYINIWNDRNEPW